MRDARPSSRSQATNVAPAATPVLINRALGVRSLRYDATASAIRRRTALAMNWCVTPSRLASASVTVIRNRSPARISVPRSVSTSRSASTDTAAIGRHGRDASADGLGPRVGRVGLDPADREQLLAVQGDRRPRVLRPRVDPRRRGRGLVRSGQGLPGQGRSQADRRHQRAQDHPRHPQTPCAARRSPMRRRLLARRSRRCPHAHRRLAAGATGVPQPRRAAHHRFLSHGATHWRRAPHGTTTAGSASAPPGYASTSVCRGPTNVGRQRLAVRSSRFIRAMKCMRICFGQAPSHSP